MHFDTIDYLMVGNDRQRKAYAVLTKHRVMDRLQPFDPILAGTIPIRIDIATSDLDILCYWQDKRAFRMAIIDGFGAEARFRVQEPSADVVVASFTIDGQEIEVFGQNIPTRQQFGYRHMLIEHRLLTERGEPFRQQILALKRAGYKTEPAFGKVLGLPGNPYEALLAYECPALPTGFPPRF